MLLISRRHFSVISAGVLLISGEQLSLLLKRSAACLSCRSPCISVAWDQSPVLSEGGLWLVSVLATFLCNQTPYKSNLLKEQLSGLWVWGSAFSVWAHYLMDLKISGNLCPKTRLARWFGIKVPASKLDDWVPSLGPTWGRGEPRKLFSVLCLYAMAHMCEHKLNKCKKKKRTKENKINKRVMKVEILIFCVFYWNGKVEANKTNSQSRQAALPLRERDIHESVGRMMKTITGPSYLFQLF